MRQNDRIRQESLRDTKGDRHTTEANSNNKNDTDVTDPLKDRYYSKALVSFNQFITLYNDLKK